MRFRPDEQSARRHSQPFLGRKGEHQRFESCIHAALLKDAPEFGDCHFLLGLG
jgi:hypothetical protein